jgi:hypothetical protein
MFRIPVLLLILFTAGGFKSVAQRTRRIYLGEAMDSLYLKDIIDSQFVYTMPIYTALGCRRLGYRQTRVLNTEHNIINTGILLQGKQSNRTGRSVDVLYTNGMDSCHVRYDDKVTFERTGRSATLSIFNLFAKSEDKIPQSEPTERIGRIDLSGEIVKDSISMPFSYSLVETHYTETPVGWLLMKGDTLYVKPLSKIINKGGKLKSSMLSWDRGYLLKKGNEIFAAAYFLKSPTILYILKSLNDEEKLIITTFLFTSLEY